ncbi:Sec-independent protein translocase protein TatC [Microbacterium suwonense]|uniref:Sec-independent protein translocase protein TatC n=2 Tax=Microbacterium suwonense TaxID=683047 RepID=A0ABN6X0Z3_9MICO|nr:twin-arginine translocase subunit TatC [Microbacterium suwonense]BDZ38329.1 Sec-independent protein translocase protein TatC [Microbacterium suwonense]
MSLGEHLREARRRLIIGVIGLAAGMVIAFIITDPVINFLTQPITIINEQRGAEFTKLVFDKISSGFNLRIRMALSIGLLLSAPVWMWQIWAFIVPGLTKKEIRYTVAFVCSAIPLFFTGGYVAVLVAPHVIEVMSNFVPDIGNNFLNAEYFYDFILKFVLVIGVSFVLPVFMVALNLAGIMTGKTMLKGWRVAVLVAALFAAIATPAADIGSMLLLAGILIVLYFAAAFLSLFFDRRKRKRTIAAGLDPDATAV